MKLILASQSPQRRELLREAGYTFVVVPPSPSAESGERGEDSPGAFALRMARQKAADVANRLAARKWSPGQETPPGPDEPLGLQIVVACDTVAECQGEILGKPRDAADARRMLELLSGREHQVISGLCLRHLPGGPPRMGVDVTRLRMDPLTPQQLDEYLSSGQWRDKAGAFGYQDRIDWIHLVEGSASNVIGLPMELLARLLSELVPAEGPQAR